MFFDAFPKGARKKTFLANASAKALTPPPSQLLADIAILLKLF